MISLLILFNRKKKFIIKITMILLGYYLIIEVRVFLSLD